METATVIEIIDPKAKFGTSQKTGKAWSMSRVSLSNGESTFMFNPIELGQVVESVQDGEYKNWRVKKPNPQHDEIMAALRKIYAAITGDAEVVPEKEASKPTPELDKVYDPDETEKIDVKDVPF